MKRLALAALMALPLMAASQQQASADGGFCCVHDFCRFRIKICAQCYPKACGCAPSFGCGGWGGDACGASFDECHGVVPGPWYTYWPYGGAPVMTSPYNFPAWMYDDNFQTPAPSPYPYWGASSARPW
jgi:hypothetical protein